MRRGLFRLSLLGAAAPVLIGLLALLIPSARAQDLLPGEFEIKFPYPLLGRGSFPTVKELDQIAQGAAAPKVVLLFPVYPDPADRGRPPDEPPKDRNDYYAPTWSPDGQSLSLLRADIKGRTSKIMLFPSLSVKTPVTLLDSNKRSYDYMFSWAMPGQTNGLSYFVFSSTADPHEDLNVYLGAVERSAAAGAQPAAPTIKGPVRLTKGTTLKRYPVLWQDPKDAKLLFCDGPVVRQIGLSGDISGLLAPPGAESADVSARLEEPLQVGYGNYPTWALDGSAIVYAKQKGEEAGHTIYDLYLRRGTGLERPVAADPGLRVRTPAWSPDGKQIAFYAAKGQSGWSLCVVNALTVPALRLEVAANVATEDSFDFVGPAWMSSGKGLLYLVRTTQAGGHYPLRWTFMGKDGGEIEYPEELTTANDLAVSPQKGVLEVAFVATSRLAQDVYVMIVTEP